MTSSKTDTKPCPPSRLTNKYCVVKIDVTLVAGGTCHPGPPELRVEVSDPPMDPRLLAVIGEKVKIAQQELKGK